MTASVVINKQERAHAKREVFVLVVVVSVRCTRRKFGLEQTRTGGFAAPRLLINVQQQQQHGHPNNKIGRTPIMTMFGWINNILKHTQCPLWCSFEGYDGLVVLWANRHECSTNT